LDCHHQQHHDQRDGDPTMAAEKLSGAIDSIAAPRCYRLAGQDAPQIVGHRRCRRVAHLGFRAQRSEKYRIEVSAQRAPPARELEPVPGRGRTGGRCNPCVRG
jgi:hypothetical protein